MFLGFSYGFKLGQSIIDYHLIHYNDLASLMIMLIVVFNYLYKVILVNLNLFIVLIVLCVFEIKCNWMIKNNLDSLTKGLTLHKMLLLFVPSFKN